jgi:hypothetical protein
VVFAPDTEDPASTLAILTLDAVNVQRAVADAIKARANAVTGIPVENIAVIANHSHYGIPHGGYGSERDDEFMGIFPRLAADAITMDDIDYITNLITPYLSDGDYAWAFSEFADQCEIYINGHINGYPFPAGTMVIVSLVIGFVVALIATGIMRAQLKSVHYKAAAGDYLKAGSLQVTRSRDIFLYRNVTRQAKPKNTSSSGGSSGGGRNVGGGSF